MRSGWGSRGGLRGLLAHAARGMGIEPRLLGSGAMQGVEEGSDLVTACLRARLGYGD